MMKPRVLLLDEPTTGLAPLALHQLMQTIRELNRGEGISTIIIGQNIISMLTIADPVYAAKTRRLR